MMTKKTNAKGSEPLTATNASQSRAPSVLKVADVNGAGTVVLRETFDDPPAVVARDGSL